MTTVDGDPLTGDPTGPDVRHLLEVISVPAKPLPAPTIFPPYRAPDLIPLIHEPCGLGQCGGCTARTCRTRARTAEPLPVDPQPIPSPQQALTRTRYHDGDYIDGNGS